MIHRRLPPSQFHKREMGIQDNLSSIDSLIQQQPSSALSSTTQTKQQQQRQYVFTETTTTTMSRRGTWRFTLLLISITLLSTLVYTTTIHFPATLKLSRNISRNHQGLRSSPANNSSRIGFVPNELIGIVYNDSDLINEQNITPPYWNGPRKNQTASSSSVSWGPCFPPSMKSNINWMDSIQTYQRLARRQQQQNGGSNDDPTKLYQYNHAAGAAGTAAVSVTKTRSNLLKGLAGFCRPGFLIIGAGKCGTSSLYHYLVGHPRVAPASEKQIHYFRYFPERSLTWYLSHFPTTTSFLASGALITGEASPGYLPYPDVVPLVASRLSTTTTITPTSNGGPKILVVGRHPLERIVSSYRYNYIRPAITLMRKGLYKHIPTRMSNNQDYIPYLFSLEDLLRTELAQLHRCLSARNGSAVVGARNKWSQQAWAHDEFQRRSRLGLPPLVDLDEHCYGDRVDAKTPRFQWKQLVQEHPNKVIKLPHLHLIQALLGRSLYVLPLEWWYIVFPSKDIYFVCTEELRDQTGASMNQVGQFLGLPRFNFSSVVQRGMYNVGGHQGYDKATPWDQVEPRKLSHHANSTSAETTNNNSTASDAFASLLSLSDDFRRELKDFIKPYNERLFRLVGRRCNW